MKKSSLKKIKKIFKKLLWILIFLATIKSAYSLAFSEIMYNPQGSDTGREWMELTNPECENLEEYKLFENNINHNINIYSNGTCEYPIICDNCELFLIEYNTSSITYESSFTLSNIGEYLGLKLNDTVIDSVNYTGIESVEGMSITNYDEWESTVPTPGYFILQEINQTINETINNVTNNITTNNTFNETINITVNQTINITINETLNETINITINNETTDIGTNNSINISTQNSSINENNCNITLGIRLTDDKIIYYNKESIRFYNTLIVIPNYKIEYYIEYWIEDIYGNILKNNLQTSNLNEKIYTPSVTEKTVAIIIKNRLINISCNDSVQTNLDNYSSERIIIIKNPDYKEKECDKCEKCENEASSIISGSQTRENSEVSISINEDIIEIDAYRGNDRKYVVNAYAKNDKNRKIADLAKLTLEKYSGVNIELPLQLDACGEFDIFAEGIGFLESSKYYKECEQDPASKNNKKVVSNTSETYENDFSTSNSIIEQSTVKTNVSQFFHEPLITGNIVYESKNEKSKDYSLIGMIVLVAGSAIYIAYKKIIHKSH